MRNKNSVVGVVGANLGFRKAWRNMSSVERAEIVAGESAELRRGRQFNLRASRENGWGFPGWEVNPYLAKS